MAISKFPVEIDEKFWKRLNQFTPRSGRLGFTAQNQLAPFDIPWGALWISLWYLGAALFIHHNRVFFTENDALPVEDGDGETSPHVVGSNSTLSKETEEIVRSHVEV